MLCDFVCLSELFFFEHVVLVRATGAVDRRESIAGFC